jgi:methyltransferase (TIGR00027 family)
LGIGVDLLSFFANHTFLRQTFSRTALRVAMRRAAHQILDRPLVLEDPYALRILPPEAAAQVLAVSELEQQPFARAMRGYMSVRSRFAEDEFARAVARGVRQYVSLGAGLDTFAWRNPHREQAVRIFEVDHPATQSWKRSLMTLANLSVPPDTIYVPIDFECDSLEAGLGKAGLDVSQPVFFSWLGVVSYLTLENFRKTLRFFGSLPAGSGTVFDYSLPRSAVSEADARQLDELAARVAGMGEPFQLFFTPDEVADELASVNWKIYINLDAAGIRSRYYPDSKSQWSSAGRLLSAGNEG